MGRLKDVLLTIEVVGKKLDDAYSARMARAQEQGFNVNQPVFHGTKEDFRAFDPDRAIGTQYWSTTDKAAIERGEVGAQGSGVIKEMYHRIQNPAGWDEYDKFGIDELISRGYDGVALPDADGQITYMAFNPNQYRDVDAMFDPAKADSPDLLAGIASAAPAIGLGALAAGGSQDAEAGATGAGMAAYGSDSQVPNYEQRLHQIPYPQINNPDGSRSTHRMAAEVDENGNWYAFPTIQQQQDGRLVEYNDNREAMHNAMQSGDFKAFGPDKMAALGYAEGGYKQGTAIEPTQTQAYNPFAAYMQNTLGDFANRRAQKRGMWDTMKAYAGEVVNGPIGQAAGFAMDAAEVPMRGYHGLTALAGNLAAGNSFEQSMMRGGQVARQPIDVTARELGDSVYERTGSPAAGALTYGITTMADPIF